jgi:hypothetical protein
MTGPGPKPVLSWCSAHAPSGVLSPQPGNAGAQRKRYAKRERQQIRIGGAPKIRIGGALFDGRYATTCDKSQLTTT